MSDITKKAQFIADTIQSLDIKATYDLMIKFTKCIEALGAIAQDAAKLERENAELKKALGLNEKSEEEPEIKIEPVPMEEIPEDAKTID